MRTGISIIIPTYNRARLLGPALETVKKLNVPAGMPIEVLIIDNNCTDETPQVIERAARNSPFPIQRIVEKQQGLCFGRNRGLREARYEHLVYLDDDVEVAREWILGYMEAIDELNADCVIGPVSPLFEQEVPDFLTQRVLDSVSSSYSRKGDRMFLLLRGTAHEIPGCNFGVRQSVAQEIGGFNNALDRVGNGMLAGGDTEFGMRLVTEGRRVVYQPRCRIKHVITQDKLLPTHLRKRWSGLGATQRVLQNGSVALPLARRLRYALGTGRLLIASLTYRLRGNTGLAFQRELEARRSWAFLTQRTVRKPN